MRVAPFFTPMLKIAQIVLLIAVAVSLSLLGWGGYVALGKIGAAADSAAQVSSDLDKTILKANAATGPIVELDKLLLAVKSTTVHIDLAARHEDQQLTVLDGQERELFADLHGTVTELKGTAIALTGTAQQATATLAEGQGSLKAAQPLLEAYTATGNDLDALLKRKALADFADNLGPLSANMVAITGTGAHMLATGDAVETKATQSYLHPSHNPLVRTWQAASPFIVAGAKITATVF